MVLAWWKRCDPARSGGRRVPVKAGGVGDDRAEGIGHRLSSSRTVEGGFGGMSFRRFADRKSRVSLWQLLISV